MKSMLFALALAGCGNPHGPPQTKGMGCGELRCDTAHEYCRKITNDVGPDTFLCRPLPASCGASPSCGCMTDERCAKGCKPDDGGFTLVCPGG